MRFVSNSLYEVAKVTEVLPIECCMESLCTDTNQVQCVSAHGISVHGLRRRLRCPACRRFSFSYAVRHCNSSMEGEGIAARLPGCQAAELPCRRGVASINNIQRYSGGYLCGASPHPESIGCTAFTCSIGPRVSQESCSSLRFLHCS